MSCLFISKKIKCAIENTYGEGNAIDQTYQKLFVDDFFSWYFSPSNDILTNWEQPALYGAQNPHEKRKTYFNWFDVIKYM